MSFTVKVATIPIRYTSIRVDELFSSEPYTFTVICPRYQNLAINSSIEILEGATSIFKGFLEKRKPAHGPNVGDEIEISGRDRLSYLDRHLMTEGDLTDDPGTLITDMLTGTELSAGTIDIFGHDVNVRVDRQNKLAFLKQVKELISWEYRLDLDDTLDFQETVGTDVSASIIITVGVAGESLEWNEDILEVKNKWYAYGKGEDAASRITLAPPYYITDATSIATYGERDDVNVQKQIDNRADLLRHTQSVLARNKDPRKIYDVTFVDTYAPNTYRVGDTIKLIDAKTAVNANLRIFAKHLRYDANAGKTVNLILSARVPRLEYILGNTATTPSTPTTSNKFGSWMPIFTYFKHYNIQYYNMGASATDPELTMVDSRGHYWIVNAGYVNTENCYGSAYTASSRGWQIFDLDGISSTYVQSHNHITNCHQFGPGNIYHSYDYTTPDPPGWLAGCSLSGDDTLYWLEDTYSTHWDSGACGYGYPCTGPTSQNDMHIWQLGCLTGLFNPTNPQKVFDGVDAGLTVAPWGNGSNALYGISAVNGKIITSVEQYEDGKTHLIEVTGQSTFNDLGAISQYGTIGGNDITFDGTNLIVMDGGGSMVRVLPIGFDLISPVDDFSYTMYSCGDWGRLLYNPIERSIQHCGTDSESLTEDLTLIINNVNLPSFPGTVAEA